MGTGFDSLWPGRIPKGAVSMNEEKNDGQVELYQAYSVQEILERRELLIAVPSTDSLSGGQSIR
jgi:hypothetical protein